jgi:hypothetical protein
LQEEKGEDQQTKPAEQQSDSLISKLFGFSTSNSTTTTNNNNNNNNNNNSSNTSNPTVARNDSSSTLLGNKPVPLNPNEASQLQPTLGMFSELNGKRICITCFLFALFLYVCYHLLGYSYSLSYIRLSLSVSFLQAIIRRR